MSAYSGLGMPIGHDSNEYNDNSVLVSRLTALKSAGITKVRTNLIYWDAPLANVSFYNKMKTVCTTALDMGFDVIWGFTANGGAVYTNTSLTGEVRDCFLTLATWAQSLSNGDHFELGLGNEDDDRVNGTDLTKAQFQAYVRGTLCTDVKAVFTKGKVNYATHTGFYADWVSGGLGGLDYFSLNLYGQTTAHWQLYINNLMKDFGAKGYISEWNSSDNGAVEYPVDIDHAGEIQKRLNFMLLKSVPRYFFFAYALPSGVSQKWATLLADNSYRRCWGVLTNKRRSIV